MMICSTGSDGAAPRLGQVRLHPAAFGDGGVALRSAGEGLERGHLGADLLAQLLGVGVQVDVELAHARARGDVDDLLRVVGGAAEACRQHKGATVVDVGVVLPGEADAAVHLDAVLCAALRRDRGEGCRDGSRELESGVARTAFARLVDRAGGVPHGGGRALGVGDHLRALVLDGLELADRPAELLTDLGVGRRGVRRPPRHPDRLSGQQRRHQRAGQLAAQVAEHTVVADFDGVRADVRQWAQRIHTLDRLDLQPVGVEHHPLLAAVDGNRQHQHGGLCGRWDRPHFAPDDQAVALPGGRQPGVDGVGRDHRPGRQVAQQRRLGIMGGDQRAGDGRGNEWAGYRAVAELGEHDRQFEDAESLPANGFGQMDPLQALLGGGLPVRRRVRNGRLEGLV